MSDLISRKMVIEALYNHYEVNNKAQNATMDECIMLVKNIPSAEPEIVHCGECVFAEWAKAKMEASE